MQITTHLFIQPVQWALGNNGCKKESVDAKDPHVRLFFLAPIISQRLLCRLSVTQLSDCFLFVNPGAHLEGPFLNPDMKGAHKAHLMRQISTKGAQEMEDFYGTLDHVSIVTLAPELAGENMESIKQLVQRNIVVSIGK